MTQAEPQRYDVYEYTTAGGLSGRITRTIQRESGYTDPEQARASAYQMATHFPVHGYNQERDYWWGRERAPLSDLIIFTVEPSQRHDDDSYEV